MNIRHLDATDAIEFQTLRLNALQECPAAFLSSYEEERDIPFESIADRLAPTASQRMFGAFVENSLVGIVGLCREERQKSSHKGYLWGMYVALEHRYRGIGRTLVLQALQFAASVPGFLQVNLFVIATNEPAVRLYESVGFQPYGLERNSICVAGEYYDEILMARTLRS